MKEPIRKGYILYNSNYIIFWKRKNYGDHKRSAVSGVREWISIAQGFFRAVKILWMILYWWIHVIKHLSKSIEYTTPRVNHNVNYELWVIIICQYRFIPGKKYIILVSDADNGGSYTCVGAGGMLKNPCTFLSILFCEPKTALKKK